MHWSWEYGQGTRGARELAQDGCEGATQDCHTFLQGKSLCVCIYTHMCVYVCVFTFVCIYVHVHQYIHTHLSIYAHRMATRFSRRGVSVCLWRRDGEYVASKHSDTRARASACAFTECCSLECFRNLRLMLLCVLHVQLIRLRKFDAPVEEGEK